MKNIQWIKMSAKECDFNFNFSPSKHNDNNNNKYDHIFIQMTNKMQQYRCHNSIRYAGLTYMSLYVYGAAPLFRGAARPHDRGSVEHQEFRLVGPWQNIISITKEQERSYSLILCNNSGTLILCNKSIDW